MAFPSLVPFVSTRGVVADTSTKIAWDRITYWLENCLASHPRCSTAAIIHYKPRRLLHIPAVNTGAVDRFYLVHNTSTITAAYASLSYCWGENIEATIRTLTDTIGLHNREGIESKKLPKTIQDAITVCHGIGLNYLWVDALCIIQDDDSNWASDAGQMYRVYANARVTIAAHPASACTESFLGPQAYGQPSWQREFTTPFPVGERTRFFLRVTTYCLALL